MTPPDLDAAIKLASEYADLPGGLGVDVDDGRAMARALLALEPVWRAAQEWESFDGTLRDGYDHERTARQQRALHDAAQTLRLAIATARRGGG